jgi:beta-glucanase (GH16 family)
VAANSTPTTSERHSPQTTIPTTTTSTATTAATAPNPTTTTSTSAPGAPAPSGAPGGAATATTPTGGSCGGQTTLVSDGSTWTCSFDSEFTGTTLDTKQWTPITTAGSGYISGLTACFMDSPNNISVGNGYLSLTARQETAPFFCKMPFGGFFTQYTSGTVSTYGLFSQTYGRFDVRAKLPPATIAGLQSSFWLVPQALTPPSEIDIAENYSEYPTLAIPTIHYSYDPGTVNAANNTNVTTNYSCTIDPTQFNDYVVEWTPTTISMIYHGKPCLVDHWIASSPLTGNQPFNQPFFINLTQALGVWTNNFNPWITPLPATTEIQYVRGWKLNS